MKNNTRSILYFFLLIATIVVHADRANALALKDQLRGVEFSIYAPDWIWQGRDINILCTLKNTSGVPVDVSIRLDLPEGKKDHFAIPEAKQEGGASASGAEEEGERGVMLREVRLGPDEERRVAFANIGAKSGAPLQEYLFLLSLSVDGKNKDIPYRVKTIRGASVGASMWPFVAIIAASCVALALILSRFGVKGAWKRPSQSFAPPDEVEDWIKE